MENQDINHLLFALKQGSQSDGEPAIDSLPIVSCSQRMPNENMMSELRVSGLGTFPVPIPVKVCCKHDYNYK
jgi:hypothetical protein